MPELPEVETMRRGVLSVVGQKIKSVDFIKTKLKSISITPRKDTFKRRAVGQKITAIDRLGKRVLMRLANDNTIVFEPRMTGLVLIADPPNQTHLRVEFQLQGGKQKKLWYWDRRGLGLVCLYSPAEIEQRLGPDRLGPDALQVDADQLRSRFCKSRREVKVALLDQKALAGIGNLYASEILHVARIHPQKRCHRITKAQWKDIHQAMHAVLKEAIKYEGSTLSDGTYRNALNKEGGYQNHHRVYARADEPCCSCASEKVKRIVQAQRSTFFCAKCQQR